MVDVLLLPHSGAFRLYLGIRYVDLPYINAVECSAPTLQTDMALIPIRGAVPKISSSSPPTLPQISVPPYLTQFFTDLGDLWRFLALVETSTHAITRSSLSCAVWSSLPLLPTPDCFLSRHGQLMSLLTSQQCNSAQPFPLQCRPPLHLIIIHQYHDLWYLLRVSPWLELPCRPSE